MPVAVKDEIDIAGEVTSRGTGAITTPATADAEVVRRLRDGRRDRRRQDDDARAGAVAVHGVDHLGRDPQPVGRRADARRVERRLRGRCRRGAGAGGDRPPTAPARSGSPPPAAGVFGLKPQSGRVPRAPHDRDGSHWICFGPLTRSVLDSAIVLDVIARPRRPEPALRRVRASRAPAPGACASPSPTRSRPGLAARCAARSAAALQGTADLLRSLGHEVVEADIDFRVRDDPVIVGLMFRAIRDFVRRSNGRSGSSAARRALARPGALVSDRALERLLRGRAAPRASASAGCSPTTTCS